MIFYVIIGIIFNVVVFLKTTESYAYRMKLIPFLLKLVCMDLFIIAGYTLLYVAFENIMNTIFGIIGFLVSILIFGIIAIFAISIFIVRCAQAMFKT